MSLCDIALYLFLTALLLQGAYMFWLAPRYLDTHEETQSLAVSSRRMRS